MNIIQIPFKGKTSVVMIVAPVGAYDEANEYKGISHFLEHMHFKGSAKRTQKQISYDIEKVGGDINAFTDWELTVYWAKVSNQYLGIAKDVISDMVLYPKLPKSEINKERNVIIQELEMYEDNPKYYVDDLFNQEMYSKESGFYLPIIGTKTTLKKINAENLRQYHTALYNDLTMIVVGDVKEKHEYVNSNELYCTALDQPSNRFSEKFVYKNVNQANVLIGGNIFVNDLNMNDIIVMSDIIESIYGDMYGRLFQKIREEKGLVYGINFDTALYENGLLEWRVSLGLKSSKVKEAHSAIIKELVRPYTKGDLEFALTKTIGNIELCQSSISNVANIVAYAIARNIDYKKLLNNYVPDVKRLVHKVNDLRERLNFSENLMVGILPK